VTLVLIVEDAESFSDPLSYLLGKAGFEVAVCSTGSSALDTIERRGAAIVLVGLMLRGPPALDVCRSVRERSDVPMIVLNGRDTEFGRLACAEFGVNDYVPQLFSWPDLVSRIQALLGSWHGVPGQGPRSPTRPVSTR
jgi:two-component system response regulator RegX3